MDVDEVSEPPSDRTEDMSMQTASQAAEPMSEEQSVGGESWNHSGGNESVQTVTSTPETIVITPTPETATPPTPAGRPRRAAATAAKERMQLRPPKSTPRPPSQSAGGGRLPSPASPPTPEDTAASDEEEPVSDTLTPPAKRRRGRKSDLTYNANGTANTTATTDDSGQDVTVSVLKARQRNKTGVFRQPAITRKKPLLGVTGNGTKVRTSTGDSAALKNLYVAVRLGEETIEKLVDGWVAGYKVDRLAGYLEMANFFVGAAGCPAKVTFAMANLDHGEIIRQLTAKFDEDGNDYPLVKPGPEFRKFRTDLCKFIETFIATIKDSIMFDDYLVDTLVRFLTEMADSGLRAFRHTGTFAALKIMTAMVQVSAELQDTLRTDQLQVDAEGKRQKRGLNQPRVQMLQQTLELHTSNAQTLKELFDKACKGVFYQRYRDCLVTVRELAMEELGEWMMLFPDRYVDDTYLKYLGWTLNDKEPSVRKKVLQAILPLYERDDLTGKLQLFSNKFKDRFVDMTADSDPECCVKAVKILCALDKTQSELFSDQDFDRLFELIYVCDRQLAVSAADFFLGRMNSVVLTDTDRKAGRKFRSGRAWSEHAWNLFEIVKFFAESPTHSHCAYLVDSLIEACPAIKAWDAMTDLLLEEPAEGEILTLSDRHEQILIEILCFAVKHAATGESPIGRVVAKKTKARDIKQIEEDKKTLTAHFITTLPALLSKFRQDMKKTMLLISLPQYFDVHIYTLNHCEEDLDRLLDVISELFIKSESDVLLKNCAKTLETLGQEGTGIVNQVAMTKSSLTEKVIASLQQSLPSWLAGASQEMAYSCETTIARLTALLTYFDLTGGGVDLWEDLVVVVERGLAGDSTMDRPLLRKVMLSCCLMLLWRVQALRRHDGGTRPEQGDCEGHMGRLRGFVGLLMPCLTVEQTASEMEFAAANILLDLLAQHHGTPGKTVADWQHELHYKVPDPDQRTIADFVDFQVFANAIPDAADARQTIIHKRRVLLTQFCRLFSCSVISPTYAATVFRNYIATNVDYGDIIKEAVRRLFESSKSHCAEAVAAALIDLFTRQIRSVRRNSKEILEIREMAKRFGVLFGVDNDKSRKAMGALHKYSVEFIRSAKNDTELSKRVLFFDVLTEFMPKLRRDDKARLVRRLDSLSNLPGSLKGDNLQPYLQYRNVLAGAAVSGDDDGTAGDKHRRGRRVNAVVPKKAPVMRIPTPEPEIQDDDDAAVSMTPDPQPPLPGDASQNPVESSLRIRSPAAEDSTQMTSQMSASINVTNMEDE